MNRYSRASLIDGGHAYGTYYAIPVIRENVNNGNISIVSRIVLQERQRLDTIAGQQYGDSRYWWLIAACSNIGWGLQCPPGTILLIPSLSDCMKYVG